MPHLKPVSNTGVFCYAPSPRTSVLEALEFPLANGAGTMLFLCSLVTHRENFDPLDDLRTHLIERLEIFAGAPGTDAEIEKRFENCLHALNAALAEHLTPPQVFDLQKSAMCLILARGAKLAIAAFGAFSAILYKSATVSVTKEDKIFSTLEADGPPPPDKPFQSVLMGLLDPDTTLMVGTRSLIRAVAENLREEIVSSLPAASAAERLRQLASDTSIATAGLIVSGAKTPGVPASASVIYSVQSRERGFLETSEVLQNRNANFSRYARDFFNFIFKTLAAIFTLIIAALEATINFIKINFSLSKESRSEKEWRSFGKRLVGAFANSRQRFQERLKNTRMRYRIAALILLLALFSGGVIGLSWKTRIKTEAARALRTERASALMTSLTNAAALHLYDEAGALTKLALAKQQLADYELAYGADEPALRARQTFAKISADLRKETTLIPLPVMTLPEAGARLTLATNEIRAATVNGAVIGAKGIIASLGKTLSLAIPIEDGFLLVDKNNALARISRNGEHKLLSGETPTKNIIDAAIYNNHFYTFDLKTQMIIRAKPDGNTWKRGVNWLKKPDPALTDALSISIDSDIYIASATKVSRYTKSQRDDFVLGDIDPKLTAISRLIAPLDSATLYVLEPARNRLALFSKSDGALIQQYVFPLTSAISDFAVNEKEKRVFLLAENKVYSAPLR